MVDNIKLKCDRCSANLSGKNNNCIFFCLDCGRGCDVSGESLACYSMKFVSPGKELEFPMEYFPFWHLKCEFSVENISEGNKLEGLTDFYIPAFFIKNINYFGDVGLYYMQKELKLQFGEKLDIPVFPADRGLKDALNYPYIYLMKEYSRKTGAEFLNVNIEKTGAGLILVPFYKKGHSYSDSYLLWNYPSGALI
ncbi:MAG: hypothetical protein ABFR36_02690 [Acidobacteriota bacterium]